MRTTKSTYWNQLREGAISSYLPDVNSPVDAAYDIPARGVAFIFTGRVPGHVGMKGLSFQQQNTVLKTNYSPPHAGGSPSLLFVVCCWFVDIHVSVFALRPEVLGGSTAEDQKSSWKHLRVRVPVPSQAGGCCSSCG